MKLEELAEALEAAIRSGADAGEGYGKEIFDRGVRFGEKYGREALGLGKKYGREALGIVSASPAKLKRALAALSPAAKNAVVTVAPAAKRTAAKTVLRAAGIAAGVTAAASLAEYAIAKVLCELAFSRELPPVVQAIRPKPSSNVDPMLTKALADGERKLTETCPETVHITSFDGTPLTGHFLPREGAERVVIAVHGWRSRWSHDFSLSWEFMHEHGCSILFVDQRACGDSGGDHLSYGLLERYDCREWIKWVSERCGGDLPVYLCGISMGAATVMMTAGLDLSDNVRGVIADCGYTSPRAILSRVARDGMHIGYGIHGRLAENMIHKKIQMDSLAFSCADALRAAKVPVLFIHGTDDELVPVEMTYENYKACASEKRLLIVPGARHGLSYYVDRESYERAVSDLFKAFDKK